MPILNLLIDKKIITRSNRVTFFKNKKVKALIGVDYAGHPCDWKSLKEWQTNMILINDGCHSIGSKINNDIGYALNMQICLPILSSC